MSPFELRGDLVRKGTGWDLNPSLDPAPDREVRHIGSWPDAADTDINRAVYRIQGNHADTDIHRRLAAGHLGACPQ